MDFDRAVAELDTLVQTLEREGDERALLLLQLVDAIHRPALELIAAGEPFALGELAPWLDAPGRAALAERLVREGLLEAG